MKIKKTLCVYKKWIWLFCLIVPFCLLYAAPKKKSSRKKQSSCPCAKTVQKIYDIEKRASKEGASVGKAYRIKDDLLISPEMIARALRCKCAKQPFSSKKRVKKKVPVKKGPAGVALLVPGERAEGCRTIMELEYEYARPSEIAQVSAMMKNLASEIDGKTVVLMKYGKKDGVTSKILACDGSHDTQRLAGAYSNLGLKKFDDYALDPKTGLVWQLCSRGQQVTEGGFCEYNPQKTTFSSNESYCSTLPEINGMRWRLPQVEELLTLVNQHGFAGTAKIDSTTFSNTPPEVYWSSTDSWSEEALMTVDFESGRVIAYDKFKRAYTRCVTDFAPSR